MKDEEQSINGTQDRRARRPAGSYEGEGRGDDRGERDERKQRD